MLVNRDNLVFVARRIDAKSEAWQMPQGGIDKGESPEQALSRELLEEIGTNHVETLHAIDDWLYYDLPDHLIGQLWGGKYRGQKQKWFLARFLGQDGDIDLNTKEPEFCDWKWEKPAKLPHIIVPFKRKTYQQVLTAFGPHLGM